MTTISIVLAIILGAAWRRMFGSDRPDWAFPGYRGLQALGGLLVLFALCLWTGTAWPLSALKAGLAIGFLTAYGQSIPHVWAAWDWLDGRMRLPRLWGTEGGAWTAYSEATAGACVWLIAVLV